MFIPLLFFPLGNNSPTKPSSLLEGAERVEVSLTVLFWVQPCTHLQGTMEAVRPWEASADPRTRGGGMINFRRFAAACAVVSAVVAVTMLIADGRQAEVSPSSLLREAAWEGAAWAQKVELCLCDGALMGVDIWVLLACASARRVRCLILMLAGSNGPS